MDGRFARRAVVRLSTIEFWERYSFYTVFILLALFLAAPVRGGGMGWSSGDTLRFFGTFLFVNQISQLVGGYVTDRLMPRQRALKIGALCLFVGHALMIGPSLIPWLVEHFAQIPLARTLTERHAPLGLFAVPAGLRGSTTVPYVAITVCFYASVTLLAIGNGLFKPVLTVVVGRLPHRSISERESAFTTFFLFANIGGLFATLLGGWLAERFGWGWAFGASALGMLVSIVTMTLLARIYIDPFTEDGDRAGVAAETGDGTRRTSLIATGLILLIFIIACSFSYQSYGFVSLFTANMVDRGIRGFVIPPSWFVALNPVTIMIFSAIFIALWRRGELGHDWSVTGKMAAAFVVLASAFACLAGGAVQAHATGLANPLWVMAAIMLIAISELLLNPAVVSAITRLAPLDRQGLYLGASAAAAGIGAWFSGRIGAFVMEADMVPALVTICGVALGCALALVLCRRVLGRYTI